MTSRSECIRGCMQPGIHFATCTDRVDAGGACTGCAPASPVDGLVVCGECRRRIRGLLRIAPDLLGRLRALAGHGKAVVYSPVKVFTPASTVPEQVDADVADALIEISANLRDWARHIVMATLDGLDRVLADEAQTIRLAAAVIDTHELTPDGGRHWSIADAASKWGVERRDRSTFTYPASIEDGVIETQPVTEWYDPLLSIAQAAQRANRTRRSIELWIERGELAVAVRARLTDGTVMKSVYASAVDAVAATKKPGRPRNK